MSFLDRRAGLLVLVDPSRTGPGEAERVARAASACSGRLIPPPTNNGSSPPTASRHARITSPGTGRGAPLPASM